MISLHYIISILFFQLYKTERIFYTIFILYLSLVTSYISFNYSRDSLNYINAFSFQTDNLFDNIAFLEPSFILISKLLLTVGLDAFYLFLTYSLISISIKIYVISKYSKLPLLSFVFYLSYFYLLQDCTQIRISTAIAFFLISLIYFSKNKIFKANIFLFIASLFHYSALILFIFNFINSGKYNTKMYYLILITTVTLYTMNISIINIIISNSAFLESFQIFHKLIYYATQTEVTGNKISIINAKTLLMMLIVSFILFYNQKLNLNKFEILSFKSVFMALILYILFIDLPQLAVRISELLMFPLIFLVPSIFKVLKYSHFIFMSVLLFLYMYFSYYIYIQKIFNL